MLSQPRRLAALLLSLSLTGCLEEGGEAAPGGEAGTASHPAFSGAESCAGCHESGEDDSILPFDTWAGTMMANAVRDPLFLAALTVANQDDPSIGAACIGCHSPTASVRGHTADPSGGLIDEIDQQGVGCESCHRSAPSGDASAPYTIAGGDALYFPDDGLLRGPYDDSPAPHGAVAEPALADSAFCGQCHTVFNNQPMYNTQREVVAERFPLDTTYLEWQQSDHADPAAPTHCIDCHMPEVPGEHAVSTVDPTLREDPRSHVLAGGNVWGIQAVKAADPDHARQNAAAFAAAERANRQILAEAVTVEIVDAPAEVARGSRVSLVVRVTNHTGHKFPTGYAESRRAWLAVTATTRGGAVLTLAGAYDAQSGELVDASGTHVYRAKPGRWDASEGGWVISENLARNEVMLKDTRIPPAGFAPTTLTMPSGDIDYQNPDGSWRNHDEVSLVLDVPDGADEIVALSAQVWFQSVTRHYVAFLQDSNTTDDRGDSLMDIYEATGQGAPLGLSKDTVQY